MKPQIQNEESQNKPEIASSEKIVRTIDGSLSSDNTDMKKIIIVVYVVLLLLGIGTGYILSHKIIGSKTNSSASTSQDKTVGSTDAATFKDSAVGTIEKGGSEGGEGTHKLIREGGPSQTVYLISSVVDLDQYDGKKVKVWGQTQAAKNVAWLMDVGKVEVNE